MESVVLVHGTFVATYLHDAHSRIALFGVGGTPAGEIALPSIGTAAELSTESSRDSEVFFAFTSYLAPTTVFRHEF